MLILIAPVTRTGVFADRSLEDKYRVRGGTLIDVVLMTTLLTATDLSFYADPLTSMCMCANSPIRAHLSATWI